MTVDAAWLVWAVLGAVALACVGLPLLRGVGSILRREIAAWFGGPVGYIYLVMFLLATNALGLFGVQTFFLRPVAEMRGYFQILAGVAAILLGALTMRVWADERDGQTDQLLLTLPVPGWRLVAGKFLACLFFYAVALAGTVTVPLMMARVSRPDASAPGASSGWGLLDPGPVVAGYVGALLIGAVYIAFGLFLSGLCRNAIAAFALTAPLLFGAYILGFGQFPEILDSALSPFGPRLGTHLAATVGLYGHFDRFARGLIELGSILFLLTWTAVFLVLNTLAIERRARPRANWLYAASLVLMLAIGATSNLLYRDLPLVRLDWTAEGRYSVSPGTERVLAALPGVARVRYYVSGVDQMPLRYQLMERNVREKLDALRQASKGRLQVEIVGGLDAGHLRAPETNPDPASPTSAEQPEAAQYREASLPRGIQPFDVQGIVGDRVTTRRIYSALEITYGGKPPRTLPRVEPSLVPKLEHLVGRMVHQLAQEQRPVVALIAPETNVTIPEGTSPAIVRMMRGRGMLVDIFAELPVFLRHDGYDVRRVDLSPAQPLPPETDALLILGPRALTEAQRTAIAEAIAAGTPAFVAVQVSAWEQTPQGMMRIPQEPELAPLLAPWGVGIEPGVLLDVNHIPIPYANPEGGEEPVYRDLPLHVRIPGEQVNGEETVTRGLGNLLFLYGSALRLDEQAVADAGLRASVLITSSDRAWTREPREQFMRPALLAPPAEDAPERRRYPLTILLRGAFPPAASAPSDTPTHGRETMVLIHGSSMSYRMPWLQIDQASLQLLLNALFVMAHGEEGQALVETIQKTSPSRAIGTLQPADAAYWKRVHIVYLYLAVAAVGLGVNGLRALRRRLYESRYR